LLIFFAWSCESSELPEPPEPNLEEILPMTYSYLALGDSYTVDQLFPLAFQILEAE